MRSVSIAGEEEDLDLGKMVREGEVAWLHKRDMPGVGHAEHAGESNQQAWHAQKHSPASPQQGNSRKRKEAPAGGQSQAGSRPTSAQASGLKQGDCHAYCSLQACSAVLQHSLIYQSDSWLHAQSEEA